jgi:hypothetical protein
MNKLETEKQMRVKEFSDVRDKVYYWLLVSLCDDRRQSPRRLHVIVVDCCIIQSSKRTTQVKQTLQIQENNDKEKK